MTECLFFFLVSTKLLIQKKYKTTTEFIRETTLAHRQSKRTFIDLQVE